MTRNTDVSKISRRGALATIAGAVVAGCTQHTTYSPTGFRAPIAPEFLSMYAAVPDERFPLPAIDLTQIDPVYFRQQVAHTSSHPTGTIIVDTANKFLYLTQENGMAMRYGIGVGRDGFDWSGRARIPFKRKWPTWTPPAAMIEREPELEKYRNGMEPGLENPLGARALYLFDNGVDTLYRLHGTNEPWSIGQAMSSGCIRLLNQDAIDLYNRTPNGTRVIVDHNMGPPPAPVA
ncbi:MAG: L,D-transpeptidase [Pseudomonadota bacterium]